MITVLQKTLMAAVLSMSAVSAAQAAAILGNFSGNAQNVGTSLTATLNTKAVGLTTGSTDLQFDSLQAYISNTAADSFSLLGGIYANNAGSLLAAFTPINIADNTPTSLFTLTANYTLSANTSYWFRLGNR